MTGERDSQDAQQGEDDGTADLLGRDLGAGHPLSAEADASEQPPPSDIDAGSPADSGNAGFPGVTDTDEPRETGDPEGDEPRVGRRSLLFGAGAGAVAASIGWVAVLGIGGGGGPDGAEGVAVDYVNAIADNDWVAAGTLFHDASEFGQSGLSYEEFLRDRQQFETYSSIEPSVESHHTFRHVADATLAARSEEGGSEFGVSGAELDLEDLDELKQVAVIASVQPENLNRTEAQRSYLGDQPTTGFTATVVRDTAGWLLTRLFGGESI